MATSRKYTDSLFTIESEWSVVDVLDANDVLDALAEAESQQPE